MFTVKLYNKIARVGTDYLERHKFAWNEDVPAPDAILVRSANLHDVGIPESVKCIARAGAGVNNIPIGSCSERASWYSTPRGQTPMRLRN
jgi:D-3-phosphoglycerate dehydrogenase